MYHPQPQLTVYIFVFFVVCGIMVLVCVFDFVVLFFCWVRIKKKVLEHFVIKKIKNKCQSQIEFVSEFVINNKKIIKCQKLW